MPSAVIVPASPALVPAISGRAPELDEVRAAARSAVQQLLATRPGRVLVVADAPEDADETSTLDLRPYGVSTAQVASGPVPVAFATAAWLLDDAGWGGRRAYAGPGRATGAGDDAVLVVADGTACRSERAPGHLDPRAEGVDARLSTALASGDLRVLDDLDHVTVRELMIGGLPALAWLRAVTAHHEVTARLLYRGAPLGVGLWVAQWSWDERAD